MKRLLSLLLALAILLCACTAPSSPPNAPSVNDPQELASLEVRFLDVGQADAALLRCGDTAMLIDGGNREDSSLIVSVLNRLGVSHLDYLVCTHAHEDHVGGLAGALNVATVDTVLTPALEYDSNVFKTFLKAAEKSTIQIPQAGDSFRLGDAMVTVLGPVREYDDTNNTSIVLKVSLGDISFLFTGDMERDAEADLLAEYRESALSSTVLKVGHHGSETSTSYPFLRAVNPSYAVISVGKGNTYGHPHDAVLTRLRDADVPLYRTDLQGDIIATTDGKTVEFSTDKAVAQTNPATTSDPCIGNKNSLVCHQLTCKSLPKEKNRVYFKTVDEALAAGYKPCSNCMPN